MKKEFIDIQKYIKLSRTERRAHLLLEEPCIEIGGDSRIFRGLLAHHLGTTIGSRSVYVCHACNNPCCSNPNHLYWGTPQDNWIDSKELGSWNSAYSRTVQKYGLEKATKIFSDNASKAGKKGGGWNALSNEQLLLWEKAISSVDTQSFGWVSKLSTTMGCSHTQVRRILKKYFSEIQVFQRKINS